MLLIVVCIRERKKLFFNLILFYCTNPIVSAFETHINSPIKNEFDNVFLLCVVSFSVVSLSLNCDFFCSVHMMSEVSRGVRNLISKDFNSRSHPIQQLFIIEFSCSDSIVLIYCLFNTQISSELLHSRHIAVFFFVALIQFHIN